MLDNIKNYRIEQTEELPEVNGTGYVLRHEKTGARVMLIVNDDVTEMKCPDHLDRQWYIDYAKRRLSGFGIQC